MFVSSVAFSVSAAAKLAFDKAATGVHCWAWHLDAEEPLKLQNIL